MISYGEHCMVLAVELRLFFRPLDLCHNGEIDFTKGHASGAIVVILVATGVALSLNGGHGLEQVFGCTAQYRGERRCEFLDTGKRRKRKTEEFSLNENKVRETSSFSPGYNGSSIGRVVSPVSDTSCRPVAD